MTHHRVCLAAASRPRIRGWETLFEDIAWRRFYTLGFHLQPWQTAREVDNEAVGRFEGTAFNPAGWKPRVPPAAFWRSRPDDEFWAARRVMALSDDMIHAVVKAGQYSDPNREKLLADVLIQRRDKIGKSMLNAVHPLINFAMDASGVLTFENAAVTARVGSLPAGGYRVSWAQFDNNTSTATPAGSPETVSDLRAGAAGDLAGARFVREGPDRRRQSVRPEGGHPGGWVLPADGERLHARRRRALAVASLLRVFGSSMFRAVVKLSQLSNRCAIARAWRPPSRPPTPSAVRAGGHRMSGPVRACPHAGSAVRRESMLVLVFYPSSRARRGPLRPSSLKPNTIAAVPSSCRSPSADPTRTVRAARVC
jgi:hypothetical protein